MLSSRLGANESEVGLNESEANLNNAIPEVLKKSIRNINKKQVKLQESIHAIPRAKDSFIKMQQYPKNDYGAHGNSYSYQSNQRNVLLPGSLQSSNKIQTTLSSNQSSQFHVTHHTPNEDIQTIHQTQINTYMPSTSIIQSNNKNYDLKNPRLITNHEMYKVLQQNYNKNQEAMKIKQSLQQSQISGLMQTNSLNCHSSQEIIQQKFDHQNSLFSLHYMQNRNQQQIIQQLHQQNFIDLKNPQNILINQNQDIKDEKFPILNFQCQLKHKKLDYQLNKQSISRSQIDLLNKSSRLIQNFRIPGEELYYHNKNGKNVFNTTEIYSRNYNRNYQKNEFQIRNTKRGIAKAISQPQLSYNERKNDNNTYDCETTMINLESQSVDKKEKYGISIDNFDTAYFRKNYPKKRTSIKEYKPKTSCEIYSKEKSSFIQKDSCIEKTLDDLKSVDKSVQKRIEEFLEKSEIKNHRGLKILSKNNEKINSQKESQKSQITENLNKSFIGVKESNYPKEQSILLSKIKKQSQVSLKNDDINYDMERLKIQQNETGSDFNKIGQSFSNVDSGRGSTVYSSNRRLTTEHSNHKQDAEWIDIVELEIRSILEPKDTQPVMYSNPSDSVSSVTPPLPPLMPQNISKTSKNQFSKSLPYEMKNNYESNIKGFEKKNCSSNTKHRSILFSKKESQKYYSHPTGKLASATTGLDLDSVLDRSDSDLSTNNAQTIRKQLEGLENMYSEVLKLLSVSAKKRKKNRSLRSYGSISSIQSSSVSSRPITRHNNKRTPNNTDDRMKQCKDIKNINKRFQRLECHVITLARSVAHLSSEMRTQHLMIQEMENIRDEIAALRTQTNMAIVRSQFQPIIKDSRLPALSNPYRVRKLTKFFGMEPPLIRLFLRELGYEKYAGAFEKERVGMVELPYLSDERLQKMGVPLGPRLRILKEARISVCKDTIYVI